MATTAWQFNGTEGADNAVLTLIRLQDQELIDVQDVAVIRWPQYAAAPMTQEHVTEARASKVSSLMQKMKHATIDGTMIENVKGDITPGTSVLVLLSSDAVIDKVATAFQGHAMELVRSDLSVPQQDQLRAAFKGTPGG
jgi:uncharacterized membrane protein